MKRIVLAFCFVLFFASLMAWGSGYSTTYQQGVADISSNCTSGSNCWYLLPSGGVCLPNTLAFGGDGALMCRGTDNHLYIWMGTYWQQQTAMGTSAVFVALVDAQNVWSLQPTAYCTAAKAGTFGIFHWTGSAWFQPSPTNACLFQFDISDGVIAGTGGDYYPYQSTNAGVSYSRLGTQQASAVSVGNGGSMCAIGSGSRVLLLKNGSFTPMSIQPPGGSASSCAFPKSQHGAAVMFALSPSAGGHYPYVQVFDIKAQKWGIIAQANSGIYSLASYDKGNTLGLDFGGRPYHYNVYAAYTGGATTGSFDGCPVSTCPNSAIHRISGSLRYPNTLLYTDNQIDYIPTQNANLTFMAIANPTSDSDNPCDPFFGDPSDPACTASAGGTAHCSVSGTNFSGAGGNTPVHVPGVSYDVESYNRTNLSFWELPFPDYAIAGILCGMTNTCLPPTKALCRPVDDGGTLVLYGIEEIATGSDPATALGWAQNGCNRHAVDYKDPWSKAVLPGAWRIFSIYDPAIGAASCNYVFTPSYSYPYVSCR